MLEAMAGYERWSDAELLGCLLQGQVKGGDAGRMSAELLSELGLVELSQRSEEELSELCGLGNGGARVLKAVFEVGRRVTSCQRLPLPSAGSPQAVADYVRSAVQCREQEEFHALLLNGRLRVLRDVRVSLGLVDKSLVHAREVYREAVRSGCSQVILAHNHPTGDVTPSTADAEITASLERAGEVLGIRLVDHVIVAGYLDGVSPDYFSFREHDLL